MMQVDLTFAYLLSGGRKEAQLFAHTSEDPRIGEHTSDYLAFFGFGSGRYDSHKGHFAPPWATEFFLFKSPTVAELRERDSDLTFEGAIARYRAAFAEVYRAYSRLGIMLDQQELKRALRYARLLCASEFCIAETDDRMNLNQLDELVELVGGTADRESVTNALVSIVVDKNGSPYICFGGPKHDGHRKFLETDFDTPSSVITDVELNPDMFWQYSSQVGTWDHLWKMVTTMNRVQFTSSGKQAQESMIESLLKGVKSFYGATTIY